MIVILKSNVGLTFVMIVPSTLWKETAFFRTFQQYFENVPLNDRMNKMQLKLLNTLAYKTGTEMTKHNHLVSTQIILMFSGAQSSVNFQSIWGN